MTTLSVIIPMYNAGDHIERTIANIHAQTFRDYELILVDNGSTDDSVECARAKTMELGMERVTFATEPTPGPSAARNAGLCLASGKYVMFIDADDEESPDLFALLVGAMEADGDVEAGAPQLITCGYEVIQHGSLLYDTRGESGTLTTEEMAVRLFDTTVYQGFIWDKLFRREVIERTGLRFDESIFYNEDRLFVFAYLLAAKGETRILPERAYHYILRSSSAMGCVEAGHITERIVTEFDAFEKMLDLALKKYGADSPLYESIWQDYVKSQLRTFRKILSDQVTESFAHRNSHLRKYAKDAGRMLAKRCAENATSPEKQLKFLNERQYLLWGKYMHYGKYGISYTRNPAFFDA